MPGPAPGAQEVEQAPGRRSARADAVLVGRGRSLCETETYIRGAGVRDAPPKLPMRISSSRYRSARRRGVGDAATQVGSFAEETRLARVAVEDVDGKIESVIALLYFTAGEERGHLHGAGKL